MTILSKDRKIIEASWPRLEVDQDMSGGDALIPLSTYLENRATLIGRDQLAIWIDSHEEVECIAGDVERFHLIALNFPAFSDGRAYSSANLLRRKYQFKGHLMAIGDVRRDQLEQMLRCGFDLFELAGDQDANQALAGLKTYSNTYQSSIDQPLPLFRRRSQQGTSRGPLRSSVTGLPGPVLARFPEIH